MVHDDARAFYAALGFATIPLRARDKRPLRKGWRDAPPEHWLDAPEGANVGIVTGSPSGGLVVLDFDTREGPEELLGMTAAQLAVVTMVVETRRGWHVYAREQGRASSTLREGVDLRGEGGMVVAPPSVHASGWRYKFVGEGRSIVQLSLLGIGAAIQERAVEMDLREVEDWIALQAPKLQEHWRRLSEPPSWSFDTSRSDFAVARCLWESGRDVEAIAAILMRLPGSRARERGEAYARQTTARAASAPGRRHAR
jgi:hypothetical protein